MSSYEVVSYHRQVPQHFHKFHSHLGTSQEIGRNTASLESKDPHKFKFLREFFYSHQETEPLSSLIF